MHHNSPGPKLKFKACAYTKMKTYATIATFEQLFVIIINPH